MRSDLRLPPILFVVAVLTVGPGGCGRRTASAERASDLSRQPVEVVPVQRRDLVETLNLVGSLAANESAQIRAEIAGQVQAILFGEGQGVEKGQILVKIDDSELLAQIAQAEARLQLAEVNLQRAEGLRQRQINTQADYDRAHSEWATVKAEQALLRLRREKTEIKAPFGGVAEGRSVSPGDYVDVSTVITTVNDLSRLKIDFQVPERFLSKVHPGTTFTVKSKALETTAPVQGEVYFVNAVIDRDTRASEVKGYLANPPPALQAGMFANIELVLDVRRGVLTVPEGAILVSQQGPQVITVETKNGESFAAFVPVRLGLRVYGMVEISPVQGELTEQTQVVAAGVGGLVIYPGARLEPRPLREEFKVGTKPP
jgi:membrane fusion protein (multidrug efflux system)